jgi:nickel/cobalt transporter (NicO) family protein
MRRLAGVLLLLVAMYVMATGHVLDQYLQAAQIAVAADGVRIELRMTPGAQVADRILSLIDADGNGQISSTEEQAYAHTILRDISLEVDGRRVTLTPVRIDFPSQGEMSEGNGTIHLALFAKAPFDVRGDHQISFRNDHRPELGVYLANTLVPNTDSIRIVGLHRDALQHELRVNLRVLSVAASSWPRWPGVLALALGIVLLARQAKHLPVILRPLERV